MAAGVAVAILLVGSVVIHEAGHILVARRHGAPARDITVGFFGPAQHGGAELPGPRAQWRVALAGPAASLALAVLAGGSAAGLAVLGIDRLPMLILGVHGGGQRRPRGAQSSSWQRGRTAAGLSERLRGRARAVRPKPTSSRRGPARSPASALVAAGLTLFAGPGYLAGLWLALIGVLAFASSRAQVRRSLVATALAGLRVSDIVPRDARRRRRVSRPGRPWPTSWTPRACGGQTAESPPRASGAPAADRTAAVVPAA